MALSSNTVTHFTKNLSSLKGILTDNFKVRYCRESINVKAKHYDMLIPMVSFCDIPFSQVLKHMDSYGNYGLGLKKNWAEENGLNPVLYLEKNSLLSENIFDHLYQHIIVGKKTLSDLDIDEKRRFDFIRYLKNYQGDLKRVGKKTIANYRFSDEREWRFVLDPVLDYPLFGNLKKIAEAKIKEAKEKHNAKVISQKLEFTPEDINYIIIAKESERDIVIETLEKVNGRLSSRTCKKINEPNYFSRAVKN